jgi:Holliday junction resolvase-like predicted endonuclease
MIDKILQKIVLIQQVHGRLDNWVKRLITSITSTRMMRMFTLLKSFMHDKQDLEKKDKRIHIHQVHGKTG